MGIDYKPLWHLLLDRKMSKTELRLKAGISTRQLAKLGRNEDVSTEVIAKICEALDCEIIDVVEIKKENSLSSSPTRINEDNQ